MDASLFDYELPADRIAQIPLPEREMSRMLLVQGDSLEDRRFEELPLLLRPHDLLVFNESRVFNARLRDDGVEVLFLRPIENVSIWEALCRPARRFVPGRIFTMKGLTFAVEPPRGKFGKRILRIPDGVDLVRELGSIGDPPLPPYIRRDGDPELRAMDVARYQTVFAGEPGSAAAPTAGLHFSEDMIRRIGSICDCVRITLHVSNATFQPIRTPSIEAHQMSPEWVSIGEETAARIEEASDRRQGRIIAVGTTVVRALESSWEAGRIRRGGAHATLFITPGYRFRIVDALLTNFHQPRSSLLVLVSAFAGIDSTRRAYQHALAHGYRFLSYGDCIFIPHRRV